MEDSVENWYGLVFPRVSTLSVAWRQSGRGSTAATWMSVEMEVCSVHHPTNVPGPDLLG